MERDKNANLSNQVTLGGDICKKIKGYYFAEIYWSECYLKIADKFTQAKKIAKIYYPQHTVEQVLMELRQFGKKEFDELFEIWEDKYGINTQLAQSQARRSMEIQISAKE